MGSPSRPEHDAQRWNGFGTHGLTPGADVGMHMAARDLRVGLDPEQPRGAPAGEAAAPAFGFNLIHYRVCHGLYSIRSRIGVN